MTYEVELRALGHLGIPAGFELAAVYEHINQRYRELWPNRVRTRHFNQTHPLNREFLTISEKSHHGVARAEFEDEISPGVPPELYMQFQFGLCEINGKRKVYKMDDVIISVDHVDGLGDWTEVEIDVDNKADIPTARKKVRQLLTAMGVKPDDITSKTYEDMIIERRPELQEDIALHKRLRRRLARLIDYWKSRGMLYFDD